MEFPSNKVLSEAPGNNATFTCAVESSVATASFPNQVTWTHKGQSIVIGKKYKINVLKNGVRLTSSLTINKLSWKDDGGEIKCTISYFNQDLLEPFFTESRIALLRKY